MSPQHEQSDANRILEEIRKSQSFSQDDALKELERIRGIGVVEPLENPPESIDSPPVPKVEVISPPTVPSPKAVPQGFDAFGNQLLDELGNSISAFILNILQGASKPAEFLVPEDQRGLFGKRAAELTAPGMNPILNKADEVIRDTLQRFTGDVGVRAFNTTASVGEATPGVLGELVPLASGTAGLSTLAQRLIGKRALAVVLGQSGAFGIYEASLSEDLSDVPKNFGYGVAVGAALGITGDALWRMEQATRSFYRGLKRVQVEQFPNEFRAAAEKAGTIVEETLQTATGITRREALKKGVGALTAASKGISGAPIITELATGAVLVKLGHVSLRKVGEKVTVIDQFLTDTLSGKIAAGIGSGSVDEIQGNVASAGGSISPSGEVSFPIASAGGIERTRAGFEDIAYGIKSGEQLQEVIKNIEKVLPGARALFTGEAKKALQNQLEDIVTGDFVEEHLKAIEALQQGGFVDEKDLKKSLETIQRDFRSFKVESGFADATVDDLYDIQDVLGPTVEGSDSRVATAKSVLKTFDSMQKVFRSFGIENIATTVGLGEEFSFVKNTARRLAREALSIGIPDLARDVETVIGEDALKEAAEGVPSYEHLMKQLEQKAVSQEPDVDRLRKIGAGSKQELTQEEFRTELTGRATGLRDQLLAKGETEGLSANEKLQLQYMDELLASVSATPEGGRIKLPTLYDTPSAERNVIPVGNYSTENLPIVSGSNRFGIVSQVSGEGEARRIANEIKDNTGYNTQTLFLPDGSHSVAYYEKRSDELLSLYKQSFSRTLTSTEQLQLSKGLGISSQDALVTLSPSEASPTTRGGFVVEEPTSRVQEGVLQVLSKERAIEAVKEVRLSTNAQKRFLQNLEDEFPNGIGSSELREMMEGFIVTESDVDIRFPAKHGQPVGHTIGRDKAREIASKIILGQAKLVDVKKSTPEVIEQEYGIPKEQVVKEKARVPTMLEVKAEAQRRGFEVVPAEDFLLVKDLDGGPAVQVNSIREALEHMKLKEPPADVDLTEFVPDDMQPKGVSPGGGPIQIDQKNDVPPSGIGKIGIWTVNVPPFRDLIGKVEKNLLKEGYADEGLYDVYRDLNTAHRNISTKMSRVRKDLKPLQNFTEAERELLDLSIRNPKITAPPKIKAAGKLINAILRKAEKETGISLHFYFFQGINDLRIHGSNVEQYSATLLDDENFGKILQRSSPLDKDPAATAYQFTRFAYESMFADEPTAAFAKKAKDKRYHTSVRIAMKNHLDDLAGVRDLDTIALKNTMDAFWDKVGSGGSPNLRNNIMDALMSLNYGANMGFRLGLPLRNLHQTHLVTGKWIGSKYLMEGWKQTLDFRGLLKGKILNQKHLQELTDKGIIFPQQLPVAYTEDVFKTELEEQVYKLNPWKFSQVGLVLYKNADLMNRMITYLGTRQKVLDALERFKEHGDFNKMMSLKESGAVIFEQAVQNRFARELGSGDNEAAAHLLALEMEEKTQFIYRRGNSPQSFRGFKGRIFGQYGTWPVFYLEDLKSVMRGGTMTKAERAKVLSRWAIANGATQAIWSGFGVDYSRWLWVNPVRFGGGPGYGAFENFRQILSGTETQRQYAIRGLGIDPTRTIGQLIPGYRGASDVINALGAKDAKEFAIDILGLPTPSNVRRDTRRGFLGLGGRGERDRRR